MKKEGIPVEMVFLPDAPGTLSGGNGLLGLLDKAPHTNAARVFVNWLASKEGLEILGRARKKPTTRSDIDESYVVPWEIPRPEVNYMDGYDWEFTTVTREKITQRIKDLLRAG